MQPSLRHRHRRLRAALSIVSVVIVFAAVVAVAARSPNWYESLWFYCIGIAALGLIYAVYYVTGREEPPDP
jgi:peptidoglycan/LPS O-acetylase OafA/YrhL